MLTRLTQITASQTIGLSICTSLGAATALALVPISPATALVLTGSAGEIEFSVRPVGANTPGAPVFDPTDNELLSPGNNYPIVPGTLAPPFLPVQETIGSLTPILSAVANPAGLPAGFGTGNTSLFAIGFPTGGGIFWPSFRVTDPVSNDGNASYNFSRGVATFVNADPVNFVGIGGAFLSVQGFANGPNAYVAASLAGTIGGVAFDPIVIAFDGLGPRGNVVLADDFTFFADFGTTFRAAGVSLIDNPFIIAPGGSITIDATLSLIADPDAGLEFALLPDDAPVPDFGTGAVPEPLTILGVTMAVGLGGAFKSKAHQKSSSKNQTKLP